MADAQLDILDSTGYAALVDADTNFGVIWPYLAEIEAARDGDSTLLTKINNIDAAVAALVAGSVPFTKLTKTQANSPYTVQSSDLAGTYCIANTGATGELVCNLPAGAATYRIAFYVAAAQNLKVAANGTEKIRYKGQQTAGGGYVLSADIGTFWVLEWMGTEWVITELIGELEHAAGNFGDLYDYICIPAASFEPCTTNGCGTGVYEYGTNDIDRFYLAFDGGATEERAQSPCLIFGEDWDLGTVKVRIDWSSDTGSTAGDTVEFGIKLGSFANDGALDAALGTAQVISDALLADNGADRQMSGATPAITVGGSPAALSQIILEIYRNTDGTDDMTEDAWVFSVTVQYKKTKSNPAW